MSTQLQSMHDTIVARATPPGIGGIVVVRLSGPRAREIGRAIAGGNGRRSHQLARATLRDSRGDILDEGMIVEMHGPGSFTGEDVVELHLHGAPVVVDAVMRRTQELGARLAAAGEFSLRGFLHGRMTLDQAEAVSDLVAARSDAERRLAAANVAGGLRTKLEECLEIAETVLADWRAALDFPEYPTGEGLVRKHWIRLDEIDCIIQTLLSSADSQVSRPLRVVLAGAPNVGKSTLLNAWAGRQRVLVDPQPGTTRDPIEVELHDGARLWTVCDTAGIRTDARGVEARGIELARSQMAAADRVVWLVDATQPVWAAADTAVDAVVVNKIDLASGGELAALRETAAERAVDVVGWISAKTGEGIAELRANMIDTDGGADASDAILVRERHQAALRRAAAALQQVRQCHGSGLNLDVMAIELEGVTSSLGDILGRNIDVEVLDKIFADFCIGK